MEAITELFRLDILSIFTGLFLILSAIIAMTTIIGKFSEIIGKPVKWIKKKNEDHELLITTAQNLNELQKKHEDDVKQSIIHDEKIERKIEDLTCMFVDKEIDDLRWEIINTADKITNGRTISRECYRHCLKTYDKYEKIIETNRLTNSEVDMSIEIIRKSYLEQDY